ncbi:MAG TPA: anti-sigma factor [Candidatus Baltobacteraceae bacterium]|nr:anti-sigma factor [Candidatus Baltobacteraceae bacterium]
MTDTPLLGCDEVRDLAPLYVLDALEPAEAAAVRDHLATCAEPHAEMAQLGGVVPYLAESLEPVEPPAAVGGRIAAAVRADVRARARDDTAAARLVEGYGGSVATEALAREAPAPMGEPEDLAAARGVHGARRRRPAWRWLLEAAAVVALVAVVGWDLVLQGQLDGARRQATLLGNALAAAAQAGSVTATLQGTGPAAGASGIVVAASGGTDYLVVSGLPDPGADRTYQAWYLNGQTAISAGTFQLGPDGVTVVGMAGTAGPVTAMALTIEPAGGSTQPTSRPIALANLTG